MNNIDGVNQVLSQIRAIHQQVDQSSSTTPSELSSIETQQVQNFNHLVKQSLDSVNHLQQNASGLAQSFEQGDKDTSIAEVMVAMQKADVSFKAVTEVRNKFIDAYQEIMRMSV